MFWFSFFSSALLPVMRSEAEWSLIWQNSHLTQQSVDTIVIWQNSHLIQKSFDKMQKLSLKVLLRFLGSYTHWNLVSGIGGFLFPIFESFRLDKQHNLWTSQVRRADCYHLYFVTKDSVGVTQFPTPRLEDQRKATRERFPFDCWAFVAQILFRIFFHSKRAIHPPQMARQGQESATKRVEAREKHGHRHRAHG